MRHPFSLHACWGNVRGHDENWIRSILYGICVEVGSSRPQLAQPSFISTINTRAACWQKLEVCSSPIFRMKNWYPWTLSLDGVRIIMGSHSSNLVCINFVQLYVRLFLPKMEAIGHPFHMKPSSASANRPTTFFLYCCCCQNDGLHAAIVICHLHSRCAELLGQNHICVLEERLPLVTWECPFSPPIRLVVVWWLALKLPLP